MNKAIYQHTESGERGVALLFALGILSALMIMGVAFVSSSLYYQNIAVNRRAQHEAALLARSAANRVAAAVMYYQQKVDDELSSSGGYDDILPLDYSSVFSVSDTGKIGQTAHDAFREFLAPYKFKSTDPNLSRLDVAALPAYRGENSPAQWIYVRKPTAEDSDEEDLAGEIIGRFAYQVLPPASHSRMVYFNVLGGGIDNENFHKLKYPGSEYDDRYSHPAWKLRWGQDISELNLDFSGGIFENWNEADLAANYADFYAGGGSSYVLKPDNKEDIARNKAWFEYWFTEGEEVVLSEAAPGNRRRFNLGPWKNSSGDAAWYERMPGIESDGKENTEDVVNKITSLPEFLVDYEGTGKKILRRDGDVDIAKRGLPFFKRIANDPAAFASLEMRRRQIVANFNDYCDVDHVPTSNIKATEWSLETAPNYTGNEKTLYINELGLGLQVDGEIDGNSIKLAAKPTVIVEAIKMYDAIADGPYSLLTRLNELKLDVECKLRVRIKLRLPDDEDPQEETTEVEVTQSSPLELGVTENLEFTIPHDATYPTGVKTAANEATATISKTDIEGSTAIQNKLQDYKATHGGQGGVELSAILEINSLKVSAVKFKPGNILLKRSSDGGADYVNTNSVEVSVSGSCELTTADIIRNGNSAKRGYCFVGGIEVKDPRQNLNLTDSNVENKNDWSINAKLDKSLESADATITSGIPSISSDSELETVLTLAGAHNAATKPANPGANKDTETATDITQVSTAFIRNAPMLSPWELGWIHRGAPFETINLKRAGGFGSTSKITMDEQLKVDNAWDQEGTTYANGDGGILDWIKFTQETRSFGKIDLNCFNQYQLDESDKISYGDFTDLKLYDKGFQKQIATALFNGLKLGEAPLEFLTTTAAGNISAVSAINNAASLGQDFLDALREEKDGKGNNVYELRSEVLNLDFDWENGGTTDAAQEELIGKTIALLDASPVPTNIFRAVIIAQTITDVGGESVGQSVSGVRSSDHPKEKGSAKLGHFDMGSANSNPEDNVHYDVITGECKILVTYERDHVTGKIRIRSIANID